jgi:hypothetical protein
MVWKEGKAHLKGFESSPRKPRKGTLHSTGQMIKTEDPEGELGHKHHTAGIKK